MVYFYPGLDRLRRALRERLPAYPRRVIWFPDITTAQDFIQAQYGEREGFFYLADYLLSRVFKYDAGANRILWATQLPVFRVYAVDYNRALNRVVVAAGTRIYELDASNGTIKREIASTSLGPLGSVRFVRYHREQPNHVFFTDYANHVFGRFNMDTGAVDYLFGSYGTPRYDNTGLNSPLGFDLATNPSDGTVASRIAIADQGNNRVLTIRPGTTAVEYVIPMSGAGYVEMWGDHIDKTYFDPGYMLASPSPFTWKTGEAMRLIEWGRTELVAPFFVDAPTFSPYDKMMFTGCRRYAAEWDMSAFLYMRDVPDDYVSVIAENATVGAGATYPDNPWATVITNLHTRRAVVIHSTQPATGYIDVPKGYLHANTDKMLKPGFTWEVYDSFPVEAGRWSTYILTCPPPVFRVRVVMGSAAGAVSIYTYGWR